MTSMQEDKKTSMDPKDADLKKLRTEGPAEVLRNTAAEDKSVYGSDTETERDVPGLQREMAAKEQGPSEKEGTNKMASGDIKSGLMVYAKTDGQIGQASGKQVGTVDRLEGEHYIKLKSNDSTDGKHHWIPLGWVERTDGKAVYLNKTQEEFRRGQLNEFPLGDTQKKAA